MSVVRAGLVRRRDSRRRGEAEASHQFEAVRAYFTKSRRRAATVGHELFHRDRAGPRVMERIVKVSPPTLKSESAYHAIRGQRSSTGIIGIQTDLPSPLSLKFFYLSIVVAESTIRPGTQLRVWSSRPGVRLHDSRDRNMIIGERRNTTLRL